MGNLLGAPVTEKETHNGSTLDGAVRYGVSSMQGWRVHMEDAHIAEARLYAIDPGTLQQIPLPSHALFAVFDGHGGTFAALYAGRNLCRVLSKQPKFVQYAKFATERHDKEATFTSSAERAQYIQQGLKLLQDALSDAFVELDREIAHALKGTKVADADAPYHLDQSQHNVRMKDEQDEDQMHVDEDGGSSPTDSALKMLEDEGDSGTTACVVVLTPEWVVCANAGDSRAVFSKAGNKAIPLSYDHKPDNEEEERRIRTAGGYVAGGRVEGDLAVSRGLGDFRFKNLDVVIAGNDTDRQKQTNDKNGERMKPGEQKVSPVPDIIVQHRNPEQDEFLIIACDGIWDVQTNYEAVQAVAQLFNEGESDIGLICEEICDLCLEMGSKDNMTVLVAKFPAQSIGKGGGVLARRQRRQAESERRKKQNDPTQNKAST